MFNYNDNFKNLIIKVSCQISKTLSILYNEKKTIFILHNVFFLILFYF
jgi:hypothetical protein